MPDQLLTPVEFAQSIKAKYPDYASVPDAELATRMLDKYPEYRDRVKVADFTTTNATDAQGNPSVVGSALDVAKDVGVGALKGIGNTVFGLGKAVHDYTPIGRISDAIQPGAFDRPPEDIVPQNTAQKVGFGAEQLAEFFVPTSAGKFASAPKWVGKGLESLKAAGLTLAQTGSPTAAGVTGAITAAIPGGAVVKKAAGALEGSAEKSVAQALGATKEWAKVEATKLAPQMLERGVGGSRAAMLEKAGVQVKDLSGKIASAVEAAAAEGKTVPTQRFVDALANAAAPMTMKGPAGEVLMIPGMETSLKKLNSLVEFAQELGPEIPFDKAQALKTGWDRIVSKAGLYGPKAMSSATDNAKAWAFREAAGSMRKLLAEGSPELATLNQEFKFWKGLQNVLTETEKRTQAQSGGLTSAITGASGAAAGFASGDSLTDRFEKALLGGVLGKSLVKAVQSPTFRTQVSGPLKQNLAEALASGSEGRVYAALSKITSALPAQVTPGYGK